MEPIDNKFKAARKASGMTIEQAANLANLSKPGYINREKTPKTFRLSELAGVYSGMTETAKPILVSAINEFFLP